MYPRRATPATDGLAIRDDSVSGEKPTQIVYMPCWHVCNLRDLLAGHTTPARYLAVSPAVAAWLGRRQQHV